jgi:hypothetical protein
VTADKFSRSCSDGGTCVGLSRLRLLAWGDTCRAHPSDGGGVCAGIIQDESSLSLSLSIYIYIHGGYILSIHSDVVEYV